MSASRAICIRCGAPGNSRYKGAQLVPVKGLRKNTGRKQPRKLYQHADKKFCEKRVPHPKRIPTSHESLGVEVERS